MGEANCSVKYTKEEILDMCRFEDIDELGNVMTYDEFTENVYDGCITDYDGEGELILFDRCVGNSSIACDCEVVIIHTVMGNYFIPFKTLYSLFGDEMRFLWFNS